MLPTTILDYVPYTSFLTTKNQIMLVCLFTFDQMIGYTYTTFFVCKNNYQCIKIIWQMAH